MGICMGCQGFNSFHRFIHCKSWSILGSNNDMNSSIQVSLLMCTLIHSTVLYCIIYKYLYYCAVLYYTVLYFSSEKSKISSFYSQVFELKDIAKIGICLLLYIQLSTEDSTVWIVSPGKGRLVYKIIERLRPTSPYPGR